MEIFGNIKGWTELALSDLLRTSANKTAERVCFKCSLDDSQVKGIVSTIILFIREFFLPALADIFFYWNLINSKSPQVYRTLLSILANLNNTVVWMVAILISKSSSPCINLLVQIV